MLSELNLETSGKKLTLINRINEYYNESSDDESIATTEKESVGTIEKELV